MIQLNCTSKVRFTPVERTGRFAETTYAYTLCELRKGSFFKPTEIELDYASRIHASPMPFRYLGSIRPGPTGSPNKHRFPTCLHPNFQMRMSPSRAMWVEGRKRKRCRNRPDGHLSYVHPPRRSSDASRGPSARNDAVNE